MELQILQRIRGDVDRLMVHREDRRRHPGNEEEYRLMRQKLVEEQNKGRGAQGALNQERETRNQRRVSESRERQQYAREREEQIAFEQSEPYPSPMSEPDPPTQPVSTSQGDGVKAKTKVSMEEYRSRRLQKEAAEAKEKRDRESKRLLEEEQRQQREWIEARKVEQARLHKIEIQQAEIAQIKYEQEQLCPEQERCGRSKRRMPNYSPAKPGRCLRRLAAILHVMMNTARSWTTMMMCLPPWTARSARTGVNTFANKATCVECRLPTV